MSGSIKNKFCQFYVLASTLFSTAIVVVMAGVFLFYSKSALLSQGWRLFTLEWSPPQGQFGLLSMVYGSFAVTLIALFVAVPLGMFTGIFTSEILPARYRFYVKSLLELLAGIPSILYGLMGVTFLSIWIKDLFHLQSGRTIFTGGILLAMMILPTLITLIDEALHNIPAEYRQASRALGLYDYEVVRDVLLPMAKADIVGAILLGLGRALGETMAVLLVIGSLDRLPSPFFNVFSPGQTITSKLGRELAESAFGSLHFSALISLGLFLLLINLLLIGLSLKFFQKGERLYD